jgi:hypothetical protein
MRNTPRVNYETRKLLEQALVFDHRPDVQRVIFISTPHHGSELASNWIGRIGAALVRTPRLFTSIYASTKPLLIADPAARPLNRMPNSVDTLEPNDRFVEAVKYSLSFNHWRPRPGRHAQQFRRCSSILELSSPGRPVGVNRQFRSRRAIQSTSNSRG